MAYSTEQDVIQVLIGRRGENRNETPAELDVDQIRVAIADADAQINLSLKRRYVVPFAEGSVPALVHRLSVNIASYLALLYFRGAQPVADDDPLARLYDRSRRMLDSIQQGRTDVDGATENTSLDDAVPSVYNEYQEPLFPLYPIFEESFIPPDKLYK
ncbi:MAG TPA: phage protein Gp36 family protein [Nitrososphaera sp.]|nr:phage protein Gp36 family protein [Nitrososphaera sp.]